MWLLTSVVMVAFGANLAAEILAEGVATVASQVYMDWFWAIDPDRTMAHATASYDAIDASIAAAQASTFDVPGAGRP